jgi:hypothetical protein
MFNLNSVKSKKERREQGPLKKLKKEGVNLNVQDSDNP